MLNGRTIWELDIHDLRLLSQQIQRGELSPQKLTELEEGLSIETDDSLTRTGAENETAVIDVSGRITPKAGPLQMLFGGTSLEEISTKLRKAEEDKSVERVIMHMDTPGGKTTGIPSVVQQIRNMETETVAFADQMLSAGYHIGSAADKVVASPNGLVGSIGVYSLLTSRAEKLEEEGIQTQMVRSVPGKAKFHPSEQIDEEAVKQAQSIVDKMHEEFVKAVATNRNLSQEFVNNTMADGKVRAGSEAEEEGFTDDTMTMEELYSEFEYDEESDLDRQEQENEFLREKLVSTLQEQEQMSDRVQELTQTVEELKSEEQQSEIDSILTQAIDEDEKFAPGRREELRETAENMADSGNLDAFKQMVDSVPSGAASPSETVDTPDEDAQETEDQASQRLEAKGLIPVHTEAEAEAQERLDGSEYDPVSEEGDYFKVWKAEEYLD